MAKDIQITFDGEGTGGSVLTVRISTPAGSLLVIADLEEFGGDLVFSGVHIQTEDPGLRPNALGWARLRQIAQAVAEQADVDAIFIKGATRTTGAGKGRIPRPIRFARDLPAA